MPGFTQASTPGIEITPEMIDGGIFWLKNRRKETWRDNAPTNNVLDNRTFTITIGQTKQISETIATEMTRKWIRFQAVGDKDKTEKISRIEAAFKRFHVRDVFREGAEQDGFFGRGHIYVDLGTTDDRDELKTPIGSGSDKISAAKVGKGSLKGFKTIEAVWCYPTNYNSHDPLNDDWYNPSWFIFTWPTHYGHDLAC